MALDIVPAPADLKAKIASLCRETYEAHRAEMPQDWPGNFFELAIQPMVDAAFLSPKGRKLKHSTSLFVAMMDERLAGYYRLSHCPTDPAKEFFSVDLQDIYVLSEFREQGVGTAMVAHAKALAKQHDWDSLTATVADWNSSSRAIFEAEGFRVESRKFSFGPNRAARDIPTPSKTHNIRLVDGLWLAAAILGLVVVIALQFR